MATRQYLAMTPGEIAQNPPVSPGICWMACHFDPNGKALCDFPRELPEGAALSLDDSIPITGHDCNAILRQLEEQVHSGKFSSVFLDFQRPGIEAAADLAGCLSKALPCPVVVSQLYAGNLTCPILLPPVPPSAVLQEYLVPWKGRDIWLELGLDAEALLLTKEGCTVTPLPRFLPTEDGHRDERLHCHYTIEPVQEGFRFTLWRTWDDIQALFKEAAACGVVGTVGLYQELGKYCQAGE